MLTRIFQIQGGLNRKNQIARGWKENLTITYNPKTIVSSNAEEDSGVL